MSFSAQQVDDLQNGQAELRHDCTELQVQISTRTFEKPAAREYADHGLSRRLGTMVRCVDCVFELLPPDRSDIPDLFATLDTTVLIQSFVMNTYGCCENLAWILVLETDLRLPDGSSLSNTQVGLQSKKVRQSFSPEFQAYLESKRSWFAHLKDFRDALAHRIPLYIPPHTVPPESREQYKALGKAASEALREGDIASNIQLEIEKMSLAEFQPIMTHSLATGANVILFHPQLLADFATIVELTGKLFVELDRYLSHEMGLSPN